MARERRINDLCERFDQVWRSGTRRLQGYLRLIEEQHQGTLLAELLPLDLEYRRNRGERPNPRQDG